MKQEKVVAQELYGGALICPECGQDKFHASNIFSTDSVTITCLGCQLPFIDSPSPLRSEKRNITCMYRDKWSITFNETVGLKPRWRFNLGVLEWELVDKDMLNKVNKKVSDMWDAYCVERALREAG